MFSVVVRAVSRHLVTRHLVTRHLVTRHLVTRHLVTRHLVTRHLVLGIFTWDIYYYHRFQWPSAVRFRYCLWWEGPEVLSEDAADSERKTRYINQR